jgi:hypothetical protein
VKVLYDTVVRMFLPELLRALQALTYLRSEGIRRRRHPEAAHAQGTARQVAAHRVTRAAAGTEHASLHTVCSLPDRRRLLGFAGTRKSSARCKL